MPLAASETVVSHAIFMQMHEGETGMMQLQAIEKHTAPYPQTRRQRQRMFAS
jgi:hypothetical protein